MCAPDREPPRKRSEEYVQKRKLMVLSEPDADSVGAAWLYLLAHKQKIRDVDWLFVRSGLRASPEEIGNREAIHIDTGLRFDGVHEFDHHQEDPAVKNECATSLIWKSFRHVLGNDQILEIMAEFIRAVDRGRGSEAVELIRGQFAFLMRSLTPLLLSLEPLRTNLERVRAGFDNLDGFYEGNKRSMLIADEIKEGRYIRRAQTPFGVVLFGETERKHKELRNFVNHNLYGKINLIIVRYGDNSVGVTLMGKSEDWTIDMDKLYGLIAKKFPECRDRVFLHQHRFLLYINPESRDKNSVPTPDELFDLVRQVHRKSQAQRA